MSRCAAAVVIGRVVSTQGIVHMATDRVRWGLTVTLCGQHVDRGWGRPTRRQVDVTCTTCRRLAARAAGV